MKPTTRNVLDALRDRHPPGRYAFFEELRCGTGFRSYRRTDDREQRIDAYVLCMWESDQHRALAYEVKVSRSDFLRELKKPAKRAAAVSRSHQYFFAAPEGMIRPDELPTEAGLVEVRLDGDHWAARTKVDAPRRETLAPMTPEFMMMIVRRAFEHERLLDLERMIERRFGVPVDARRERCRQCGRDNPVGFQVPDDVWRKANGWRLDGVLCISCFAHAADQWGIAWDREIELYPVSAATAKEGGGLLEEPAVPNRRKGPSTEGREQ